MPNKTRKEWYDKKYANPKEKPISNKTKNKHTPKKSNHKHLYDWKLSFTPPDYKYAIFTIFTDKHNAPYHISTSESVYFYQECSVCNKARYGLFSIDIKDERFLNAIEVNKGIRKYVQNEMDKYRLRRKF